MRASKIFIAFALVIMVLVAQIGTVFAAAASETLPVTGTIHSIVIETDVNTTVTTVAVEVLDSNNVLHTFQLNVETALALGLITTDENGNPILLLDEEGIPMVLGTEVTIDPATAIPDEEAQHPVGAALATFFEDITTYDTIMEAHEDGVGFGVIAQALWLTLKIESDLDQEEIFHMILDAKQNGDFSGFEGLFEDGSIPNNWGQFRKAVLDGDKKGNLGMVMSDKNKDNGNNGGNDQGNGGNGQGNNHGNHGQGNDSNGQGNNHGNHGQGNGNGNK